MDPVTLTALLRVALPLGASLIRLLRLAGKPGEADEIEAILRRSDAVAQRIIDRARDELERED